MNAFYFYTIVLLFFCVTLKAQTTIENIIAKEIKQENSRDDIEALVSSTNTLEKLWDIESHLTASNKDIRYLLYNILYDIGKTSQNEQVTERTIYLLIDKGLTDAEATNIGRTLELLMDFAPAQFTPLCRNRLGSIVMAAKTHVAGHIKLAGYLRLTGLMSFFEDRLVNSKNTQERWMLSIALARMGDIQKRDECLGKLEKLGFNDQTILYLLPDILFIEDRVCINFVLKAISLDNFECYSTNPDHEVAINCAIRLIEQVAPYIINFPVTVHEGGDLNTNNYNATLQEVRQWIVDNQSSYQLIFEQN